MMSKHKESIQLCFLRRYYVPILTIVVVIGQQLYFSTGFIIQTINPKVELNGRYSIFLLALFALAFLLFFKRLLLERCSLNPSAWAMLTLSGLITVLCLTHRNEYLNKWDFLIYYIIICLPAFVIGITLDVDKGYKILADMVKMIDALMLIMTAGVFAYEYINYSLGFTNRALGGVTYQLVSYIGALGFGMNCAMLSVKDDLRFPMFRGYIYRNIQVALLFAQIICVILSGGRGCFVLLCVYGISSCVAFADRTRRNIVPLAILLLTVMLSIVLLASNTTDISNIIKTRGFERIFTYHDNRSEVFDSALRIIVNHPLIGCGVGGYISELGIYPHNIILEILLNWGFLGLFIALIIVLFTVARLFRLFKARDGLVPLVFIGIFPVVFLMLSSSFMANATLWFYLGLAFSPLALDQCNGDNTVNLKIDKTSRPFASYRSKI